MKEHQTAVRQEDFDALLALFSQDRDEAGLEYERVRSGLVRYFEFRGCADAESLADETLNRVALKAAAFNGSQNVKLSSYVYGFASNVFREYLRSPRTKELAIEADDFVQSLRSAEPTEDREPLFACLHKCLARLQDADRKLVVDYYSREKQEKIALRKELAEHRGCRIEVLHTQVFRLKTSLRDCVKGCMKDT